MIARTLECQDGKVRSLGRVSGLHWRCVMIRQSISHASSLAVRALALVVSLVALLVPVRSAFAGESSSYWRHLPDGETVTLGLSQTPQVYHAAVPLRHDAQSLSAHLMVSRHDNAALATRSRSASPDTQLPVHAEVVVLVALLPALLLALARWWKLPQDLKEKLKTVDELGTASWDFSQSWASTLTAVGALLGTLLSEEFLPDKMQLLSASEYAALNFIFGVLIVIAPLVFNGARKIAGESEAKQYVGSVRWFFFASTVTLWAVLGEVITIFLMLGEIRTADSASRWVVVLLFIVFWVAVYFVSKYAWNTMYFTIEMQLVESKKRVDLDRSAGELQRSVKELQKTLRTLAKATETPRAEIAERERQLEEKKRTLEEQKRTLEAMPPQVWSIM
jgi:hypothetical protein